MVKLVMPLADAYVTCPTAYSTVTLIFEVLCEIRKVKETLGLRRSCSDEEIKQAYRALALKMPSCTWKERGHWAMTYKKGEKCPPPPLFGIRFLRNHPDKVSWHGSGLQCSKAPPLLQVQDETRRRLATVRFQEN